MLVQIPLFDIWENTDFLIIEGKSRGIICFEVITAVVSMPLIHGISKSHIDQQRDVVSVPMRLFFSLGGGQAFDATVVNL